MLGQQAVKFYISGRNKGLDMQRHRPRVHMLCVSEELMRGTGFAGGGGEEAGLRQEWLAMGRIPGKDEAVGSEGAERRDPNYGASALRPPALPSPLPQYPTL